MKTLLIIKPDGMRPEVFKALDEKIAEAGLKKIKEFTRQLGKKECETLYAEHNGKSFFEPYTGYMSSAPVKVMVLEGENAIQKVRNFLGATNPEAAEPGTLRRDYKLTPVIHPTLGIIQNTAHASSEPEAAQYEVGIFFPELVS